jgi:hypothetical protein
MAPSHGVHMGMKVRAITLVTLAALVLGGCWSDEDLLFPRKLDAETVRLRVPGVEFLETRGALTQGLNDVCQGAGRDTISCHTLTVAGFFNTITFKLIEVVNNVMDMRPSKRRTGLRVWGPYYQAEEDRTVRFELRRDSDVGEGGYRYCLHFARGNHSGFNADRDVACGTDASDFVEIFGGTFVPEDPTRPDDVGVSVGTMDLNLTKQREAGLNDRLNPLGHGRFQFTYDTTQQQQTITIGITNVTDDATGLPASAQYTYHRTAAQDGLLSLELHNVDRLDELALLARWDTAGATRVDARGTNFLPVQVTYRGWECTNADLTIVTRQYEWAPERTLPTTGANEALCPTGIPPKPDGW